MVLVRCWIGCMTDWFVFSLVSRMMAMVNDRTGQDMGGLSKHVMEINPNHRIIVDLNVLRQVNNTLAEKVARQVR